MGLPSDAIALAYYQTNWFRALCAVFLLTLLWAAYQLRVRRFRHFGSYAALVGNFSVDDGAERAGVRWFELRRTGAGPWTVQQEGTFAPADGNRDGQPRALCARLTSPSKRPTAKTPIIVAILGSARNIFSISMRSPRQWQAANSQNQMVLAASKAVTTAPSTSPEGRAEPVPAG